MRLYASGPRGAATAPDWRTRPLPTTAPPGDVEAATLALLRRCEGRPGDVDTVLTPFYGLGDLAGQSPLGATQLERDRGLSRERTRWLSREAAAFARTVGPPESLAAAVVDMAELAVIGLPQLSLLWNTRGRTARPLHPEPVAKIAGLFGPDPGWRILRNRIWAHALVATSPMAKEVMGAVEAIRGALRTRRMLAPDEVHDLVPGLPAEVARRLLKGCGWLAPDREHAVDGTPRGIDTGLGRALAAATGPLSVQVLHGALRRWAFDSTADIARWLPDRLEQYLGLSALYAGSSEMGWAVEGAWPRLTVTDALVLQVLADAGGSIDWLGCVTALQAAGLSRGSAEHVLATSPVLVRTGRATYEKLR